MVYTRSVQKKSNHCYHNENGLCDIAVTWQPRRVDWNVHVWTMTASHCPSQWGWQMPLSQHVYCVTITFKLTEPAEQWLCIRFCIKLERSSMETIGMIQKAAAVGNWGLAASSQQRAHSCIICCAEFFWWNIKSPRWLSPPTPQDLVPCDFWLSPKLKSPFKGKRFQTIGEIQENTTGQLMVIGRTVWGPRVPTLKGTEASLSCV